MMVARDEVSHRFVHILQVCRLLFPLHLAYGHQALQERNLRLIVPRTHSLCVSLNLKV
jgi:hypothetical protein